MAAMGMANMKMEGMTEGSMSSMKSDMSTKQPLPVDSIQIGHANGGHGPGAAMIAKNPVSRFDELGLGLENVDHRVLVYST